MAKNKSTVSVRMNPNDLHEFMLFKQSRQSQYEASESNEIPNLGGNEAF